MENSTNIQLKYDIVQINKHHSNCIDWGFKRFATIGEENSNYYLKN